MNEKQLVINTMDEAKYRELSRKGRIRGDELNIVDDDSENRTTLPSYDLFETKTESLQTQITDTNVNNLELSYDAETRKIQLSGKDAVITELDATPFVSDNFLSAAEYRDGTLILYVVQDGGKTNEISVVFPVDAELNPESSNPIQNKAVYAEFQNKLDKSDESVVKYVPHTSDPSRKIVVLKNHDEIIGTRTDGAMVNLAMVSKWDVADFGSNAVHLNLNSKDAVTINDSLSVLTNEDKTEIKTELQNKANQADLETAKDDLNRRVDDLDTKTSDRERELGDEIVSTSEKIAELQDAIDNEIGRATAVEREICEKVESVQNEKADKTELDSYYTKIESDGRFLTEHQDISGKVDKSDMEKALSGKIDKTDETIVKFQDNTQIAGRRKISLNNYDNIVGKATDGIEYNLAMISKWDVADFGSTGIHLNLNSKDAVTINDSLSVLTNEDKTEIKTELQNKTDKTDFETAKDDLNGRVDDLDTKTSDRERELADEITSVSSKMPELQDAIDSEAGRAKSVERELGDKVESIQNEKADKTTLDSYYTKDEADGKFLTEHQDISGKADKSEVEESLAGKIDKTDESVVRFQPNEQTAGRKKISLNNYDNIVGKAIDGTEYNLAMISKWDVADFGSTGVHMNLNTNNIVTINDTLSVLTTTDKNEIATDISQKISALEAKLSAEYVKRSDYDTLLSRVNDLETRLQNIEILLDPTWRATTINTETAINTDKASAETINLI